MLQFAAHRHLANLAREMVVDTALPSNLFIWSQLGSMLAAAMSSQIGTGIFLSMFYSGSAESAFYSIEHIMRSVAGGFMIRYAHVNGSSVIFGCVYIHIFRGFYFGCFILHRDLGNGRMRLLAVTISFFGLAYSLS